MMPITVKDSVLKFFLWIMIALCMIKPAAFGQNVQEDIITARVTQLAGQNVYLDAGINQGIAQGDTLQMTADASRRLLVLTATATRSVSVFAHAPFPLTRGVELSFTVLKGPESLLAEQQVEEVSNKGDLPQVADVPPVKEPAPAIPVQKPSPKVKIDGRLIVSLSLLDSETKIRSSNVPAVSRRYATPSLNLNATVSNLPSGARLNVHMRTDYRYRSRSPLDKQGQFRAYRLNLEKSFGFGEMQVGRFYNRYAQRGGYWDGVSFLAGSRQRGIGGAVGFMPERSNEGFTTQFPGFSVFAHYETPGKAEVRYRAAATYNEIQPSSLLLNHRYTGFEQRLEWTFLSLDQDLQLDQDPVSKQWMVSNLQFNTRFRVGEQVSLRGRYMIRQPYRIYNIDRPFLTRRDQYGAGINVNLPLVSFGGSYTVRLLNQNHEGETINGHFNTRPLTRFDLSFSGSANRWASDFGTALYFNGGVARSFGKLYARTDYGFYRSESPNLDNPIDMHRATISLALPLKRSIHWRVRGNYNQSQLTQSISLDTSLQVRF